ncbi:MAG: GyrI-like domain-containing protein [Rickettsiales endosymbiont of Dermacentor nuttalli]
MVLAQRYVKFTTSVGKMFEICVNAWKKIWSMTPNKLGGERNYVADFEIYDNRTSDPKNTILDIYIGIKN